MYAIKEEQTDETGEWLSTLLIVADIQKEAEEIFQKIESFEGIVLKIGAATLQRIGHIDLVCIMRERVDGDTLPASLITEDDSSK